MKNLQRFYLGAILLFTYLPLLSLVIFSFNSARSLTRFTGFSMHWYVGQQNSSISYNGLLYDKEFIQAIIMTILVAIVATIVSTIIGTLAAIALSKSRRKFRTVVLNITNIPIVNPEIVTAVSLMMFFIAFGISMGYGTMIIAHIAFCTPYVLIAVYPQVRELDPNTVEAALDLGATPARALRKVMIPQLKTAIFAGASIAFTMSFDDFIISYFTAGSATNISIHIYASKRPTPVANAFSTILILCIALFILVRYFGGRKKEKMEEK